MQPTITERTAAEAAMIKAEEERQHQIRASVFGEQLGNPVSVDEVEWANRGAVMGGMEDKAAPKSTNPKDLIGYRKPPVALVPPSFEIFVSQAMKLGAKKYGPYNWRKEKVSLMTYLAAARRHIDQFIDGEDLDTESGVNHLAHAAACMAISLDALATNNLVDDRPPKGAAAELIKQFTEPASTPK